MLKRTPVNLNWNEIGTLLSLIYAELDEVAQDGKFLLYREELKSLEMILDKSRSKLDIPYIQEELGFPKNKFTDCTVFCTSTEVKLLVLFLRRELEYHGRPKTYRDLLYGILNSVYDRKRAGKDEAESMFEAGTVSLKADEAEYLINRLMGEGAKYCIGETTWQNYLDQAAIIVENIEQAASPKGEKHDD